MENSNNSNNNYNNNNTSRNRVRATKVHPNYSISPRMEHLSS